jgi:D-alanyl-D-alanine carboxypeptidase/D-alanyl-D-alanine-endopeptidase (penicillin-binding protein 4)
VALKTGTLNEPVSVCGIAGYLRKRDGGWIAFAVIVNGGPGRKHIPNETAMRAAQSDLEDILARD